MADPWCFFASLQTWHETSPRRRPAGSVSESPWRGDGRGIRHRFVLARVSRALEVE